MSRLRKIAESGLTYDTPEAIEQLKEFTYTKINEGESKKRILELAKYNFDTSMTAVKIEEVINTVFQEQG